MSVYCIFVSFVFLFFLILIMTVKMIIEIKSPKLALVVLFKSCFAVNTFLASFCNGPIIVSLFCDHS